MKNLNIYILPILFELTSIKCEANFLGKLQVSKKSRVEQESKKSRCQKPRRRRQPPRELLLMPKKRTRRRQKPRTS